MAMVERNYDSIDRVSIVINLIRTSRCGKTEEIVVIRLGEKIITFCESRSNVRFGLFRELCTNRNTMEGKASYDYDLAKK